jgi:hypothetical protein
MMLMRQAVRMLAECITFDVPTQDMSLRLSRMPTHPRSGVCFGNVRLHRRVADIAPALPAATGCPRQNAPVEVNSPST